MTVTNDSRMVHKAVVNIAKEMAGAYYERRAGMSNSWYAMWPNQTDFIRKNWKNFVLIARQTLAKMLGSQMYDESTKAKIYEILTEDATLPYHPKEVQVVNVH